MKELIKDFWLGMPIGMYVLLIAAFGLMLTSFLLPPAGVIAPSVLQGTSILMGFGWLYYVSSHFEEILKAGGKVKASVGNIAAVEIGRKKEKESEDDELSKE